MKKIFLVILTVYATVAFAETFKVKMKSIGYDPKNIQIKKGDTVEWVNEAYTKHSATSDDGKFDTGMVEPHSNSKAIEFHETGTFTYHCAMHGKSMNGSVVVVP